MIFWFFSLCYFFISHLKSSCLIKVVSKVLLIFILSYHAKIHILLYTDYILYLHSLVSEELAKTFADAVAKGDTRIVHVSIVNGK